MPLQSDNYKRLISNCGCKPTENLTKQTYNNNHNKPRKVIVAKLLLSQNKSGGGRINYGNFGSLFNGRVRNNNIVSNIISDIKTQQNRERSDINFIENFNNNTYINNIVNSYNEKLCVLQEKDDSKYNYNQFYNNYYELQNILNKNNSFQNYCQMTKKIKNYLEK